MTDRAVLIPLDLDPAVPPPGSRIHTFEGTSMGTTWTVRVAAGRIDDPCPALQAELDAIVAQMSHWEPGSLLSRYNRAPAGTWIDLPEQFFDVVDYALWAHMASGGAYDPAAGALVDLWGFGAARRYDHTGFYAPTDAAIERTLDRRAAARLSFDRDGRRLLQPGGIRLDLSSIAKGYAVDRLALRLERHGVRHYLVEVGGELRGAGVKPDGHPWWVEVEGVPDGAAPQAVVALHGLSIATSGDYRQYFEHGARRVSHTLDPRTGRPAANDVASVTVLAPTCMEADALSTVLTVLGPDDGIAFAEARALAARLLVRRAGMLEEITTPAWKALLQ